MIWNVCMTLSVIAALIGIIAPIISRRSSIFRRNVFYTFFIGIVAAIFFFLLPIYWKEFAGLYGRPVHTICLTIYNTIALFLVGGDYTAVVDAMGELPTTMAVFGQLWASILFVISPCLTFGFILSFFGSIRARVNYLLGYSKDAYVFSELCTRAVILAKDLVKNNEKRMIIFANVSEDDADAELLSEAKQMGAVLLSTDITEVNFALHHKKKPIHVFLMGENETVLEQTLQLTESQGNLGNLNLYIVADSVESELILGAIDTEKIKMSVRRIHESQAFVYRHLYEEGQRIFSGACERDGKKDREIHAVVAGMNNTGTEMVKALSWYGQMIGYQLFVDGYSEDASVNDTLIKECPELFDDMHNGVDVPGEANYTLEMHALSGDSAQLIAAQICEKTPTYVFVDFGDDAKNIETAIAIRITMLRAGKHPDIDVVVRNPEKNHVLQNICNRSNQQYEISFIGKDTESFSEQVILHSDLEAEGLKRHLQYCQNADVPEQKRQERLFWRYEYNYRSSIASAIHKKAKLECGIAGADKKPEERSEEERIQLRILEHRRWNAYMRSEGYCYAPVRNNLAKLHHCLIPYEQLPLEEQLKDDD